MDWHTLVPKLASHVVASAHPVEGGTGSSDSCFYVRGTSKLGGTSDEDLTSALARSLLGLIRAWSGAGWGSFAQSTLIEGGGIGIAIETATSHIKVETVADGGGSVVKLDSTYNYKLLSGVEVKDEIAKAKKSVTAIFKPSRPARLTSSLSHLFF
ncbi:pathogenesis-related protein 1-like [Phragmites australis]|uniref:pathogenesis-related protein 1-like n=1 Tax=Phragmites australis TaxID=29695 RepID=UPI002D794C44|nr:pathogenesis-related protein 1-like [Phragmites australis]